MEEDYFSNYTDYEYDVDDDCFFNFSDYGNSAEPRSWGCFYWDELLPALVVYSLTLLLGVVGNVLIVFTTCRYRRMKTPTNVFLSSLACADLLLIIICIPVKVAKLFSYTWEMGFFLCKSVHYLQNMVAICSVLTLTAISVERYYAIVHPMKAKYICTISQAKKIILSTWVASVLLAMPTLHIQVHMEVGHYFKAYYCSLDYDNRPHLQLYMVYMLFLIFIIPTTVMLVTYSTICWEIRQVMKQRHHMVIKMLVLIVVVFVVCWAPILILDVLTAFQVLEEYSTGFLKHVRTTFHLMSYFNSCVNPIIYGFMSKNFRESFQKALSRCCRQHLRRQLSVSQSRGTSIRFRDRSTVVTQITSN
ncbi:gastrin/cholecystokinin type B receptor-like isoform X2 [Homalodisca vitripennis]|uniref:gastrin/cholecystokinin type B receptor-like isoform X2 n=1 Tax=Homalodisca vitripennis TaxID=197043 RepID=UPI001EEB4E84|nr:gastrin/cholecystokinin type B receptor-like isoform X2 [Homalodisca vitripennis]